MGNQLPVKCVAACNPNCCANCINPQTGRTEEGDGSTGASSSSQKQQNIFANAASVLSSQAEELALDDHLEKELANEVELWRMETTTVPGGGGLAGLIVKGQHQEPSVPFPGARDRSASPTGQLRTQVSLHDRVGLGTPQQTAAKEHTFASNSGPGDSTRESTARPEATQVSEEKHLSAEDLQRSTSEEVNAAVAEQPRPKTIIPQGSPRGIADSYEQAASTSGTATTVDDSTNALEHEADIRLSPVPDSQPERQQHLQATPPRSDVQRTTSLTHPQDAMSELTSEDSTFVGFIEDTLEREAYFNGGEYRIWFNRSPPPLDGTSRMASPDKALPQSQSFVGSEASGVLPDRTHLF